MKNYTLKTTAMMCDMMMCSCSFMVMNQTMVSFHVSYPQSR